ncbi:hypothetical protein KAJ87_01280 [Candidatus Pacearchaeota archaeon]|nr:hypothetical protein [Candidatus Pacearchaeota archaeon]
MKKIVKENRGLVVSGILIVFFIISVLMFINYKGIYSSFDYDVCKQELKLDSNDLEDAYLNMRDINICGNERKRLEFQRNVSFVISLIFFCLMILSLKIDKLKNNRK